MSKEKNLLPQANKNATKPEGKGGLCLGDGLAIFLGRPFNPEPNCKVAVWRKRWRSDSTLSNSG